MKIQNKFNSSFLRTPTFRTGIRRSLSSETKPCAIPPNQDVVQPVYDTVNHCASVGMCLHVLAQSGGGGGGGCKILTDPLSAGKGHSEEKADLFCHLLDGVTR